MPPLLDQPFTQRQPRQLTRTANAELPHDFSPLAFDSIDMVAPSGVVCLTGVSGGSRKLEVSADHLNLEMVLSNKVVFGTVNANRRHFELGVRHLLEIEARWPGLLSRMITRRLPLTEFARAFERSPDHVKSIVEIS